MVTASTIIASGKSNGIPAVFWAGLVCGILDISSAFIIWVSRGIKISRGLQSIASGALGPAAFQGGNSTAALGLGFHFLIAYTATLVFYLASRRLTFMTQQPFLWGPVYGILVYAFMNLVVLPLSLVRRPPYTLLPVVIQICIHMTCIGLTIALMIKRFAR